MGQSMNQKTGGSWNNLFVHLLLWGVIFILPYFFMDSARVFTWRPFLRSIPQMLGFMLVFYLNFFLLIDQLLFKGKPRAFILWNLVLIIAVAFFMHYSRELLEWLMPYQRPRWRGRRNTFIPFFFLGRNATSLFLMTGLSVALKMTVRWLEVENERKELAKAKSEAELQNLKNQIKPTTLPYASISSSTFCCALFANVSGVNADKIILLFSIKITAFVFLPCVASTTHPCSLPF